MSNGWWEYDRRREGDGRFAEVPGAPGGPPQPAGKVAEHVSVLVEGTDARTEMPDYDSAAAALRAVAGTASGEAQQAQRANASPYLSRDSLEYPAFREAWLTRRVPADEAKASRIAEAVHRGQTDQAGEPYFLHPKGVVELLATLPEFARLSEADQQVARQAAWLHDALEDTVLTAADLRDAGFEDAVVGTVEAVTARSREPREDYYARILACGPVAVAVKLADLAHNSLPERRDALPGSPGNPVGQGQDDRFARLGAKYAKAYRALGAEVPAHLREFAPAPLAG